jgi:hypothetical protein
MYNCKSFFKVSVYHLKMLSEQDILIKNVKEAKKASESNEILNGTNIVLSVSDYEKYNSIFDEKPFLTAYEYKDESIETYNKNTSDSIRKELQDVLIDNNIYSGVAKIIADYVPMSAQYMFYYIKSATGTKTVRYKFKEDVVLDENNIPIDKKIISKIKTELYRYATDNSEYTHEFYKIKCYL